MADFIDKLSKSQEEKLFQEMKMDPKEDFSKVEITSYGGKLFFMHGHNKANNRVESIYTDFMVEKIYGDNPSLYVQKRYQNTMKMLCGKVYEQRVEKFNQEFSNKFPFDYMQGEVEEELENE